jgi:hypothetical protein
MFSVSFFFLKVLFYFFELFYYLKTFFLLFLEYLP